MANKKPPTQTKSPTKKAAKKVKQQDRPPVVHPPKRPGRAATNAWIASLPPLYQVSLRALRDSIRAAWPQVYEYTDYSPNFYWRQELVGFNATRQGCSFFVLSEKVMEKYQKQFARYRRGSITIYFKAGEVLPDKLVRKLVLARVKEMQQLEWWRYYFDEPQL